MLKMTLLLVPLLMLSLSTHALETDNYIVWDKELRDSADDVNTFITEEINEALRIANNKRRLPNCRSMTLAIAKRFKSRPPSRHPIEDWILQSLDDDQVYPKTKRYIKQSIYVDPFRFYLRNMPLSPNVQIGGVYLGTDKLSHFSSTGRRYLSHYLRKIKKGWTDIEAQKSAIRKGLKNEATFLGQWTSGVFSYGDMEANYQGFLFFKNMCMNESDNYLTQEENGHWKLVRDPDLRDYVNPFWDETFNRSYRIGKKWYKTSRRIQAYHCNPDIMDLANKRMDFYRSLPHTSLSLEYIDELQEDNYYRAPLPQEMLLNTELCAPEEAENILITDS